MKKNVKTYVEFINEKVKHEGDMWNVYSKSGRKLLGSFPTRLEARNFMATLEGQGKYN